MIGFGRVAALELPDFRPRLVDLDATKAGLQPAEAATALAAEILNANADGEVAYRDGQRFVARLARCKPIESATAQQEAAQLAVPRGPFQLRITQAGSFDALKFVPVEREPPGPGQVEIEVRATGLNFSDVLKALGLYPGIKDAIVPLGIEASGRRDRGRRRRDAIHGRRRSDGRRAVRVRVPRPHGRIRAGAQAEINRSR